VPDGANHVAFAYSEDGKNGFTTIYPNLNLVTDTKLFADAKTDEKSKKGQVVIDQSATITPLAGFNYATYKSKGTQDQDWFSAYLIPDSRFTLMDKSEVLPNTKYTFSFLAKGTGTHWIIAWSGWAQEPDNYKGITLTPDWKRYTFTVTSKDTIPTNNIQFFLRCNKVDDVINIMKPKVEKGTIDTPWAPSFSEATAEDYPSYIGTYTDNDSNTQSTDPLKYTWKKIVE
jgi:hypothetical protein